MENTFEIFADYSCPWCYFMMPNIERLKSEFGIETKWRAFLLRPYVPVEGEKFNSIDLIEKNDKVLERVAKEQNLPWTKRTQRFRTQPAHIIAKWADENNIGDVYRQTVYYYYFVLQKNIALNNILKEIIIKTGFYEIKPKQILTDKRYLQMFEEDLKIGNEIGIKEAPAILYNNKLVSGFVKYVEIKRFIIDNDVSIANF